MASPPPISSNNGTAPAAVTPPATDGRKRWQIGTLSYTSGALAILFGWLLWGDFAWQMRERSVGPVLQVMLKQFKASDFLTGLMLMSIPSALSLLIAPVVGYRSDRHRSRLGRRIPFLLYSTPFAVASLLFMSATPWLGAKLHIFLGANSLGENACVLIMIGISWTVFESAAIICNALFGALINDVVPKEMLGRFFGLFRACSLLAGILFNKTIFAHADEYYTEIFIGLAVLFGVGFSMMCLRVKEGDYPPPPPPDPKRPPGFVNACKVYYRECYTHGYYLTVFLVTGVIALAFMPINLYSVYYADSINMSRQSYGDHIAITYMISLVSAYFLGWLADKFHPLRMGIFSLCLYVMVMIWGGFAATDPTHFGIAFVGHGVASGMYFTTTASLQARLFPHSRFAQFASASVLLASSMSVFFPMLLGRVLDLTGRNYQQTFFWGAGLAIIGVCGQLYLHSRWMKLGGAKNYQAPAVD